MSQPFRTAPTAKRPSAASAWRALAAALRRWIDTSVAPVPEGAAGASR